MGGGGIFGGAIGVIKERQQEGRQQGEWNRENQIADLERQLDQIRQNAGQPGADQDALAKQQAELEAQLQALYKQGQGGGGLLGGGLLGKITGRRKKAAAPPYDLGGVPNPNAPGTVPQPGQPQTTAAPTPAPGQQQPWSEQVPGIPGGVPGMPPWSLQIHPGMKLDQVHAGLQQRQSAPPSTPPTFPSPAGALPTPTDPAAAARLARLKATAVYPPASQTMDQPQGEPYLAADGKMYQDYTDGRTGQRKTLPYTGPQRMGELQRKVREAKAGINEIYQAEYGRDATPEEMQAELEKEKPYLLGEMKASGTAGKPGKGWQKDSEGRVYNVQLDNNNQPIPGTENYNLIPPSYLLDHIRTGMTVWTDDNGNVHRDPYTATSHAILPGEGKTGPPKLSPRTKGQTPAAGEPGEPAPAPPPAGGAPRAAVPSAAVPTGGAAQLKAQGGDIIGYKGSQELKDLRSSRKKAFDDEESIKTWYQAAERSADAARSGDAQAQVGIMARYIKSTVTGGGTGIRVTQTEWNASSLTPFFEQLGAHFTDQGTYGFSGPSKPLSDKTVDRMLREIRTSYGAAVSKREDYDRAIKAQRASDTGQAPSTGKPKWSRSKFKAAHPGISDADVKAVEEEKRKTREIIP